MSTNLERAEFSKGCERAMRSSTPVPFRNQKAWLADWQDAVDRMKYLKVEQIGISDSLRTLIRVRGSLKRPNLSLDLIKPDVETLWTELSAHATEAFHSVVDRETGFEFSFYAIENNSYITGTVTISRSTE